MPATVKSLFIADLAAQENQCVTGFFAASNRQLRTKSDGSSYLSMTLCDATGQIEGRMWDCKDAGEFRSGDILKLRATVCRYQEKLQLKIDKLRRVDPALDAGEYDPGDFVPKTACNLDLLWSKLTGYIASFTDPHLQALLQVFLVDPAIAQALREAPAAKALHHAWLGGLLEHIVSLLDLCEITQAHYNAVGDRLIHRDLLLAGAILHDIGKVHELRWGTSFSYSTEGQLLGHISIGIAMIDQKLAELPDFPPRLRTLLLHIVLSHHGRLEFGSPKLPMIPEALLLHYLDDLEAKMQTVRSEFARTVAAGTPASEPTDYIRSLERPLLDTRAYLAGE